MVLPLFLNYLQIRCWLDLLELKIHSISYYIYHHLNFDFYHLPSLFYYFYIFSIQSLLFLFPHQMDFLIFLESFFHYRPFFLAHQKDFLISLEFFYLCFHLYFLVHQMDSLIFLVNCYFHLLLLFPYHIICFHLIYLELFYYSLHQIDLKYNYII